MLAPCLKPHTSLSTPSVLGLSEIQLLLHPNSKGGSWFETSCTKQTFKKHFPAGFFFFFLLISLLLLFPNFVFLAAGENHPGQDHEGLWSPFMVPTGYGCEWDFSFQFSIAIPQRCACETVVQSDVVLKSFFGKEYLRIEVLFYVWHYPFPSHQSHEWLKFDGHLPGKSSVLQRFNIWNICIPNAYFT